MSYPQSSCEDAQQKLDTAWVAFTAGDLEVAFRILARMVGYSDSQVSASTKKVAACLLSYGYDALQGVAESIKREFALAMVRQWLFSSFPITRAWDKADEPVATIIGTSYILDIDFEAMGKMVYGERKTVGILTADEVISPVPFKRRTDLWPELVSLPNLSLAARKIFVRAMQCVQVRSGFVEYRPGSFFVDRLPTTSEFDRGLTELAKAGLIDLDPSRVDLLMNLTVKDLKQFAFEHGVKPHGPKRRLVQSISDQVGQEKVKSLLNSLNAEVWYIRPLVANLPSLKKYVWSEVNRIELYLEWVQHIHCLRRIPIGTRVESSSHPSPSIRPLSPPHRRMEPWIRPNDNPRRGWTRMEKRLVREVWDSTCDEIVRDLADKYAWYAPCYIGNAIVAHLPPDKLAAFKQACEENETHVYYNLLMRYGEWRLAQMKVAAREPRLLKCAGCGREFREWSVHISFAKKVGHKIRFCNDCYGRAFPFDNYGIEATSMSQDDPLDRLAKLAAALESVPLVTFVRQPDLASVSEEKQIAIVKALLDMPSYRAYVETFGSWLKALVLAGVLEAGIYRTPRGVRCIAVDGHECLSIAEKTIDDWLSANGVPHEIEPVYPYHFELNPSGRMRADWKVGDVFIEYAGLMDDPEYAAKMESKRELAAESHIPLIVVEPKDILNLDRKLGRLVSPNDTRKTG